MCMKNGSNVLRGEPASIPLHIGDLRIRTAHGKTMFNRWQHLGDEGPESVSGRLVADNRPLRQLAGRLEPIAILVPDMHQHPAITPVHLKCSHRHQPFELSCIVQHHCHTVLYLLLEKIQLSSVQTTLCALKHLETDRHPNGTRHGRHNRVERRVGHHGVGGPRMQRWSRLRDAPMVLPAIFNSDVVDKAVFSNGFNHRRGIEADELSLHPGNSLTHMRPVHPER
mmetsp:Transcript_26951/g.70866  ORF Transcript_26951/g.70866 Transcript_26951/m.70866 type:complete len:225 (-) Transcript_26951:373-1047(-)